MAAGDRLSHPISWGLASWGLNNNDLPSTFINPKLEQYLGWFSLLQEENLTIQALYQRCFQSHWNPRPRHAGLVSTGAGDPRPEADSQDFGFPVAVA